jgi:hypothetical protein
MTPAKEAAAKLAEQIFARVEDDRVLIKEHITEILEDGLILFAAKNAQSSGDAASTNRPASYQLTDAAYQLIRYCTSPDGRRFVYWSPLSELIGRIKDCLHKMGAPV